MTQTNSEKKLKKYLFEHCDNAPTNDPVFLGGILLDFGENLEGFPDGIEEAYLEMNDLEKWKVVEYIARKMKQKEELKNKGSVEL